MKTMTLATWCVLGVCGLAMAMSQPAGDQAQPKPEGNQARKAAVMQGMQAAQPAGQDQGQPGTFEAPDGTPMPIVAKSEIPINLKIEIYDLKIGDGAEVRAGDTVRVHYRGTFRDGREFDSSVKRGQPA